MFSYMRVVNKVARPFLFVCKIPHLAMVMDNGQQTSPRNSSSAFLFLEGEVEDLEATSINLSMLGVDSPYRR